eukprot:1058075-Rhodomonas_salina.1
MRRGEGRGGGRGKSEQRDTRREGSGPQRPALPGVACCAVGCVNLQACRESSVEAAEPPRGAKGSDCMRGLREERAGVLEESRGQERVVCWAVQAACICELAGE